MMTLMYNNGAYKGHNRYMKHNNMVGPANDTEKSRNQAYKHLMMCFAENSRVDMVMDVVAVAMVAGCNHQKPVANEMMRLHHHIKSNTSANPYFLWVAMECYIAWAP